MRKKLGIKHSIITLVICISTSASYFQSDYEDSRQNNQFASLAETLKNFSKYNIHGSDITQNGIRNFNNRIDFNQYISSLLTKI